MQKLYLIIALTCCSVLLKIPSSAQSVLNPNDPIVEYDPNNIPPHPFNEISKWVRTKTLDWNSDSYKAYIFNGYAFRLKFPKTYNPNVNDGKKYPMAIVFHGGGEAGPITDNETQLYHGGPVYGAAVDDGTYDGYVLFPQSQGFWGSTAYQAFTKVIDYMIVNNKLDPFRVSVNGLSSGGQASWEMLLNYTPYIAASLPMSYMQIAYKDASVVNTVKFTPMWNFQGALDGSPAASTSEQVHDAMVAAGGNYRYTEYANLGHGTWDAAFAEPDFFPFMARAYCSNPWTLFGRTEFCPADSINLTIGLAPGFNAYQWRKNGVVITNATSNTLKVTQLGTYDARVKRDSIWSDWSHTPILIKIKSPTVTPPITVSGLMSNVIPAADGKNYVNLQEPEGYTSYRWKKVGKDSVIGTQRILTVTQPGDYTATVTEQYGCSSIASSPFTVVNAYGNNAPDVATNVVAFASSSTQIEIDWANNPHPTYNETAFEIYRSVTSGGPYTFAGQVPADILTFFDKNLSPNVKYFYKVRAVNKNGAAPLSNEASAITQSDKTAPTAPTNLKIVYATNSSISIAWDSSTDNVGIAGYDVFINGTKSYSTAKTNFIANGLQKGQLYSFYIKAKDSSGNYSPQSSIVSAAAVLNGLIYKYYEGAWYNVPNFNTLTPVAVGVTPNVTLSVKQTPANFAFLWEGFIRIPVAGRYKFETRSNDGSLLWLNAYDPSATPLVNNDGVHAAKFAAGNVFLQPGIYPISIGYFQTYRYKTMQLYWSCSALFGDSTRHPIADEYFNSGYIAADTIPVVPNNISANGISYNKIKVSWADKSNNEMGFQIYRSLYLGGTYKIIFTTAANITQFIDSNLAASTKYFYKINAVNQYGTSAFTTIALGTTQQLPPPPNAPANLQATALSTSAIKLQWNDIDTTEINYQVYRSIGNSSNFKLLAVLPANSNAYIDSSLYGNINYYYKVSAIGLSGSANYSSVVSAKTKDNAPIISDIPNRSARYGITTNIQVSATDADGDSLLFLAQNLPPFASFRDNRNRTATLTLNPSSAQQGTYNKIKIIVKDNNGGADTTTFNLTVNDNYDPTIDNISDYTLNENDIISLHLTAHDQNSTDVLSWSVSGLPNAFTLTSGANGFATLLLHPNYAAAGVYTAIVNVSDGRGGLATRQFQLTVNDKDPNVNIYVRFKDQDAIGSPWNSVTGVTTNNLKDGSGSTTNVGLALQTSWWAAWHEGPQTGNNSGIYPDAVLKDYYYFGISGGPETVSAKVTGLDTSRSYNLSFYAGSNWSGATDNGTTTYTVGTQTVPLYVQNNTQNTANINSIKPAADGTITFTMAKGANTPVGYINALVITSLYDDGTIPIAPKALTAQNIPGQGVRLSWQDVAYNETSYRVYRSINSAGPFNLINSALPANTVSYLDSTVSGNTHYYYEVRAVNARGSSAYSNIADIITTDKVPQITPIANVTIKNNQQLTVNVKATDDSTDHITLTASNLPPFVTFTDNGNGTGKININPTVGSTGTYPGVTITATDNSDSSSSISFTIIVTDQIITSVYLNFSDGSLANNPWNNLTGWPFAGTTFTNMIDDSNNPTGISVTFINGFQGVVASGMQPGNGKTVYPEVVTRTAEFEGTNKTDSIQIAGLSSTKKYNFVFFNSHDDGLNGLTNFTINNQTVSLNATYNINKTVQINGISPDANGKVLIKVAKSSGADYAYISSLVIQSYDNSVSLLSPTDLLVTDTKRSTISLQWADRSYDETGFEIWRATDGAGQYSLLTTVAANTTAYTDASLSSNTTYYYIVRSINGSSQSAYSNVANATTYAYSVYINYTNTNEAPAPWNNTNALPQDGYIWNNFLDDAGVASSIGMEINGNFNGLYGAGMNTGNNSGIFPDNVMIDSYGLFEGNSAAIKITGLDFTKKYNFTFFASSQAYGDVNGAYTINGKTCVLNASLNKGGTVTMYDVVPDNNGEVTITIAPNTSASQFGLIGALIIQGYTPSSNTAPQPPATRQLMARNSVNKQAENSVQQNQIAVTKTDDEVKVYPNPFHQSFTLVIPSENNDNLAVLIYDINGRLVYSNQFNNLVKGENYIKIEANQNLSAPGVYTAKILFTNRKAFKIIKLVKE
ncbi:MAG: fibronectin type III domain-containing protein [Chitinophagaceae bacterium]